MEKYDLKAALKFQEQNIVEASDNWFSLSKLISIESIIESGEIPIDDDFFNLRNLFIPNLTIDLSKDDALNQALDDIEERTINAINKNKTMQDLLKKESWDKNDRQQWEKELSSAVSEEFSKTPGLKNYRNTETNDTAERHSHINDLSKDIKNGTNQVVLNCENMSPLEGIELERIEKLFLPAPSPDQNNYKTAGKYYAASGYANILFEEKTQPHAWIMSGMTGNIIETTVSEKSSPYFKALSDNPIHDFLNEKGIKADQVLYGSCEDTVKNQAKDLNKAVKSFIQKTLNIDEKDITLKSIIDNFEKISDLANKHINQDPDLYTVDFYSPEEKEAYKYLQNLDKIIKAEPPSPQKSALTAPITPTQ